MDFDSLQAELLKQGELANPIAFKTKHEQRLASMLIDAGFQIIPSYHVKEWEFDIKLQEYPILIEVDGVVHDFSEVRKKCNIKDRYAQSKGFKVLRFSNEEVSSSLVNEIKCLIKDCSINRNPKEVWLYKETFFESILNKFKNLSKGESK